jgi:hypothetical protein
MAFSFHPGETMGVTVSPFLNPGRGSVLDIFKISGRHRIA